MKLMGGTFTFAALSAMAPLSAVAARDDRSKEKSRLVFYFTGTGNSLFVAKAFSDSPLSIPQELKKGPQAYKADEIGFVFPDYASSAPKIVRKFLENNTFEADYIFSVITYGNFSCDVTEWWNDFAKGKGVSNDYINAILMVDNFLPVFDMNEQMAMDKDVDENLAALIKDVGERKEYIKPGDLGNFTKEGLKMMQDGIFASTAEQQFTIDKDKCVKCMTCGKVCPHGNFSLVDDAVTFAGECETCYACVQNCPQKALSLKSRYEGMPGERNPQARYRNPNISLNEIIRSNRQ